MKTDVPYYLDYLPLPLLAELERCSESVAAVPGLKVAAGLRAAFPDIETDASLKLVCDVYTAVREQLNTVLEQRAIDRSFVDEKTKSFVSSNTSVEFRSNAYQTVVGLSDEKGRLIVGEKSTGSSRTTVDVPEFLKGEHITLFGPPDTEKMSINAMNAVHRKPANEAAIIGQLVDESGQVPRWGADNEDSKTPIMSSFLNACRNLVGCFERTLEFEDVARGKTYTLAEDRLAIPIKRIPGIALPDGSHLLNGNPIPLHIYDFVTHMFHNWSHEQALVFYVPKLENEEEAEYIHELIAVTEAKIRDLHPEYKLGSVRLFIVFENPRAIFRIEEMAEALAPYFLGGSLGWHDFLGSTARLFRYDPRYRIPVKADPNIVINHIRESHEILYNALTPIGAVKIGGMYGILPEPGNEKSHEVSLVGFIRDVVTQLKRGLNGFWVAHPDFVRPGIALVHGYRRFEKDASDTVLFEAIKALVANPIEQKRLCEFVVGEDVPGLSADDDGYERSLLAADIEVSDVISNDDPDEVRYNIFQALQYLADWLRGNGCVALPAKMRHADGSDVFVRIMDDLATTERSRWELWAEVHHGRVSEDMFEEILAEEMAFIRGDRVDVDRRVEVAWDDQTSHWYPVAEKILRELVVNPDPPEFATEILMAFTFDIVRNTEDPWATALSFR